MVAHSHTQDSFLLDDINVSPAHNSLSLDKQTIKLQPKAMEVLYFLAKHHLRVVSTQELMEQLWPGRVVTQGSVQKSINAIRNALNELNPNKEFIIYYSKRGYQLQVPVNFAMETAIEPTELTNHLLPVHSGSSSTKWKYLVFPVLIIVAMSGWVLVNRHSSIPKLHKIHFSQTQAVTQEAGHERNPTPHPDNKHIAYVTEKFIGDNGQTESRLLIRNNQGQDWQLALTEGSWFKLAWSPSGKHLAAIEVKRSDNRMLYANFYEKANFIYSFHFFTLDLEHQTLLEKQTLSQWQGRIFSLSWWDDTTLEIVAKQGPNAGNVRYRYAMNSQNLTQLNDIEGATNPSASSIHNQVTALASQHGKQTQIDFLDPNQHVLGRFQLNHPHLEISWIPDGSGILALAEETQSLFLLYRDGQILDIPLQVKKDTVWSKARFNSGGDKIYLTQEERRSNIQAFTNRGEEIDITQDSNLNFEASYSPLGDAIVYASVRNNNVYLYLVKQSQVQVLTQNPISERVGKLNWDSNGNELFFNAGNKLYHLDVNTKKMTLLRQFDEKIEAIRYNEKTKKMLIAKSVADVKNLWEFDLTTQSQRQITYGSLAGIIATDDSIYLQYLNELGLWRWDDTHTAPQNIAPEFPINSRLLALDNRSLYFISGGTCRESDVMQFDFQSNQITTRLIRKNHQTNTTSYHPMQGLLQTTCYIPESNIITLF